MTYLDGVRVLDLSRVLAGPLATQVLADLGAEVLKIEPPGGDTTRTWGPPFAGGEATYYQSVNRNKASLVLDLKTGADRERLAALAERADVVVHNYTPEAAERLGLDGILARATGRSVVLGITGYRGERREEVGYDLVLQAEAGWMAITGPAKGDPHRVGVAVVDVLTGMMAANGVLAALVRRARHGGGAALGVSLFQTAVWSLVNVSQAHLSTGEPSGRHGNRHPSLAPYELFRAADGALVIGVGTDAQYERLCDLLGIGEREGEAALRGLDNTARVGRREAIGAALGARTAERRRDELLADLRAARIPAGPVLRPDEAITAARAWDPGAVLALEHGTLGTLEALAPPLEGDGLRREHTAPPGRGEGGEEMAGRWLRGESSSAGAP